ncbi:alkyldihydroxyacetonephosphate synthase [Novymonas esmeraldas]|uniref:Alkylglycerone-phosphate synthase n=1 Tax=Novymonas esmeraldas TaxID=1808958 RepID=A0AAW0F229_9TRYP
MRQSHPERSRSERLSRAMPALPPPLVSSHNAYVCVCMCVPLSLLTDLLPLVSSCCHRDSLHSVPHHPQRHRRRGSAISLFFFSLLGVQRLHILSPPPPCHPPSAACGNSRAHIDTHTHTHTHTHLHVHTRAQTGRRTSMSTEEASTSARSEAYDTIKWNGWGREGVQMELDEENPFWVRHVDGKPIKNLLEFLYKEISGGVGPKEIPPLSPGVPLAKALAALNPPKINDAFMKDISAALESSQVRPDGKSRLCHIVGKNYRDLWRVRRGAVEHAPDCILLPNNHKDCVTIMELAHKHNVVVIPFGGGTNVTGGVEADPFERGRMIVSVDMRRMNRMISIDRESCLATFETGVLGPDLDEQLYRYGFMCGHDPDSYIYSTLGGWIGARGSGAMSNQYGDIEDMVVAVKVATPTGVVETPVTSRTCGVDLNGLFIGCEGAFGIITEATIKLERLPEEKLYEGYIFPTFEAGFSAFYSCGAKGIHPCTMRLYDEDDFRMSMAMGTATHSFIERLISKGVKSFLESYRGWNLRRMCLVIVGFEGTPERVRQQRSETAAVFKQHGGVGIGRGAGDSWQEKKYDLPYIRDFALSLSHWADVFETSVLYSQAIPCWRAVKAAVRQVWKEHGHHGWIGCHTAHQYKYGCCLYFTFASVQKDDMDMKVFLEIKKRATEAMLRHTGNLTHHHGIGYEHVPWMSRFMKPGAMRLLYAMKKSIDPRNICNPGKLLPSPPAEGEGAAALKARQEKEMMFDKMGVPGAVAAHL